MYRSPISIPPIAVDNLAHYYPLSSCTTPSAPPRTIENIQLDAKDRFAGVLWIVRETNTSIEDYLTEYDSFEKYSETKTYRKHKYQAVYKGLMRDYQNYLCIFNESDEYEYYVVAKRVRSELESLEPYCPCLTCKASRFNPLKYLWCPTCTKCLKAGSYFADPEYIKIAKENKNTVKPDKYKKLREIINLKMLEYVGFAIPVILAIYCATF